jgi:uncharacterized protein YigE (DUF2233 family)
LVRALLSTALLLAALPGCGGEQPGPKDETRKVPWTVAKDSGWKELEPGLELREEALEWKQTAGGKDLVLSLRLTAVRLDPKRFAMRIAMNPVKDGRKLLDVARAEKVPVVSNGAYFGTESEPVTLLVSEGKALSKLSKSLPRGGVFTLDAKGGAAVVPVADFEMPAKPPDFAIQNSPLLVAKGKAVYAETQVEHRDGEFPAKRHRRTGLGVDPEGRVVLLVCNDGIWLAGFAQLLAAPEAAGGFALEGALNLDGGPSSGLAVEHEAGKASVSAFATIPHVVAGLKRDKPLAEK